MADYKVPMHPYTIEFPVNVVDHGLYASGKDHLIKARIDVMAEDADDAVNRVTKAIEHLIRGRQG